MLKFKIFFNNLIYKLYHYRIPMSLRSIHPDFIEIVVTSKCNYDCEMCPRPRKFPQKELIFSDWEKIITDPIFSNIKFLCISGGEPFIHQKLLELTELFLNSMPKLKVLHINTNGFFTQKIISLIKTLSPLLEERRIKLSLLISLDGIEEKHNYIRGNPQAFYKTTKTILALKSLQKEYSFNFVANCVLSRKNLHEINDVAKWCKVREIPFRFTLIGFFNRGILKNIDKERDWGFREEDEEYLFKILENFSSDNYTESTVSRYAHEMLRLYRDKTPRATSCPFTLNGLRIDSFGNVYYCYRKNTIGNFLNNYSISKIYYNSENLISQRKTAEKECRYCNSSYWCELLPKRI